MVVNTLSAQYAQKPEHAIHSVRVNVQGIITLELAYKIEAYHVFVMK